MTIPLVRLFKDGTVSPLKNTGRYESMISFGSAFISFHLVVRFLQRTGRRLSRNGCWNRHIRCRRRGSSERLMFGERCCNLAWCYSISRPWLLMDRLTVIVSSVSKSTSCAHVGLSLSPIITCCAVLIGQSCDIFCASTSIACCQVSIVWYQSMISPLVKCDGVCFTKPIRKILIPLPTRYWHRCFQASSLIPRGAPYRLGAVTM
jgi:hypothetical protein